MEIVDCIKDGADSINFVDDRNRLVGFDTRQKCCEEFGWEFCKFSSEDEAAALMNYSTRGNEVEELPSVDMPDLSNAYFAEEQPLAYSGKFKIEGSPDCNWLILYNFHNGYYCHGFIMKDGDKEIYEGSL